MEELVKTPGGLRPKSMVHLIENGFHAHLQDGMLLKVKSSTNTIVEGFGKMNSAKREQAVNRNNLRAQFAQTHPFIIGFQSQPITDRWIIYSGWLNNSDVPISYFSTRWTVPPPPATDNGQLIYLFNGIENAALDVIIQPVLQWGSSRAGGGSFWSIANWFVGSPATGIALHSNLVPVNSGDVLEGIITLENKSGTKFTYQSSFKGVPECDLRVSDIDELTWANETLECYDLQQFSDYPDTSVTAMTNIEIRLGNNQANLIWEAHNDVIDNGQHCAIIRNASPGGQVNLHYK